MSLLTHRFAALRASNPGTAADHVPLLLFHDVGEKLEGQTNFHQDFYSLYLVRRGRGTHRIGETAYSVSRGDIYVMRPGMEHRYEDGDALILDALHFQQEMFDAATWEILTQTPGCGPLLPAATFGGRWLHLTPGAFGTIDQVLCELRSEWERGTPAAALLVRAHLLRLLLHLARLHEGAVESGVQQRPGAEAAIAAAVRHLDAHFAEPVRIEKLASQVGFSADRFTELFTTIMGRTPSDYLRHLRVERAVTLLHSTDATLAVIARQTGFADAAHLSRTVRAVRGLPPGALRRVTGRSGPWYNPS